MIDMFTINTFAGRAELQCGSENYTHNKYTGNNDINNTDNISAISHVRII